MSAVENFKNGMRERDLVRVIDGRAFVDSAVLGTLAAASDDASFILSMSGREAESAVLFNFTGTLKEYCTAVAEVASEVDPSYSVASHKNTLENL